ncbi:MAG TPA: hypothetical protein VMZ53_11165 [Kofleriaceae bacterium]|nr:hypothetical protein [Kofleriaceae bacterium]
MSLKHFVIVSILGISSFAFAGNDNKPVKVQNDNTRMWTLQAQENHAAKSNDSKTVTDPGVLVDAQRDPHDKK